MNGSDIHVKFVDWIPGICSALGMLVINSIDKARLSADSFSYSGNGVAWKARLVLFLGFALMAGGLAGSVVWRTSLFDTILLLKMLISIFAQAVLVLKYILHEVETSKQWFGISNVIANALIMLR